MNAIYILPDSLYCKTEKGLAVLRQQKRTLSLHMRQVLVLVDGRHTARELVERLERRLEQLSERDGDDLETEDL